MFIYAIRCSGTECFKIGYSIDPKSRLAALQSGNPCSLVLAAMVDCDDFSPEMLERQVHHRLRRHRLRGEWFDIDLEAIILNVALAKTELLAPEWVDDGLLDCCLRDCGIPAGRRCCGRLTYLDKSNRRAILAGRIDNSS
jgi:hypothetical protein